MSVDPYLSKGDIVCHLVLPILVGKDKRVLSRITTIILAPSDSWMVRVIELLGELGNVGNRTRRGGEGNGRVILSEPDWFVILHVVV